jgi:hypothetical protein
MNCDATFPDGKRAVLRAGTAGAVCFSVCRYVWLERQIAMALAPPPPQQLADYSAATAEFVG